MIGIIIFIIGLGLGSFLNVVILRLKSKKSFIFGRSFCPRCQHQLAWFDNLPVLSFIFLKGRCRYCQKKISWQYPLVELATALIFFWLYWHFGLTLKFFFYVIFAVFLLLIFVYDLKYYLILDSVVLPAMALAFILNLILGVNILNLFLGTVIGGGFFALQYFISKGQWVGDGDIRLGILMGLILGWKLLLVALFIAYITGAFVGLILIISGKKQMSSRLPFGPFLAAATFLALIYGSSLLSWYLRLIYL
jgi:prepilin signal peptidase PulO-like enzyme (type II secretory pathway)